MICAAKSHIGLVRQMNQDSFAIHDTLQPMSLVVVADGMGGASAGEVASRIAVEKVLQTVDGATVDDFANPEELLLQAVDEANQEICKVAATTPGYLGMGTTVVAVLADSSSIVIAHAGDSRAYGLIGGQFQQLTADHSLVAELVRRGQLTEREALNHPQRHIVTRSLGTLEFGYADVQKRGWTALDAVLLCTDGLSNLIADDELEQALRLASEIDSPDELDRLARNLVTLALDRGGHDNITLILLVNTRVGEQP